MAKQTSGTMHEDLGREDEVVGSSDRSFGLTFAVVFALIGTYRTWAYGPRGLVWLVAAAVFCTLALLWPAALAPLNRLWLKLGLLLYKVVNPIVMGLIFLFAITPVGFAMRLFGKDPLRLKREPGARSYWIERDPAGPAPESLKNQF